MFCQGVGDMPDIDFIRADIEHRRRQVLRLRGDWMLDKIDQLCAERDRLNKEKPGHNKSKVFGGRHW